MNRIVVRACADADVEPDRAVVAKVGTGLAGGAIQCDQSRIERADEYAMPANAVRSGLRINPRADAAIAGFVVPLVARQLRIVAPDLLAGCRVQCEHDGIAGGQVEPAFGQYGVGLERKFVLETGGRLAGAKAPGFFKLPDVCLVDLRQ